MEPGEILKPEAFDNFITIFIPGALALLPYNFILIYYSPYVADFWKNYNAVYISVYVFFSLFVGLIIEGPGIRLETFWDWLLDKDEKRQHIEKWRSYLKLTLTHELIAQRYLSGKVIGLKFELNITISLLLVNIGAIWLYQLKQFCSLTHFFMLSTSLLLLNIYILWESYRSALLLSDTRSLILEAIDEGKEVQ